jgi:hypothetical protein
LEENFDRFQFEIYKEKEMADFRKYVYALAVLALLLGSAVSARAQTPGPAFQCVANAGVPALLRAEGLTELNGEVTLNCTGVPVGWPTDGNGIPFVDPTGVVPPPGVTPATVNIQVFLNTNITSRWADPESEALLLIDDPPAVGPPGPVNVCEANNAADLYSPTNPCNAIQGQQVGNNSMLFLGVPVLPPGSSGVRVYRIVNVRANASSVAPGGSGTPGQIITLISATPATSGTRAAGNYGPGPIFLPAASISSSFPINNPQQITGFVQNGLAASVREADGDELPTSFGFSQCVNRTTGSSATTGRPASGFARARFAEGFATSFKTRTSAQAPVPGVVCSGTSCAGTDPSQWNVAPPVPQDVPGAVYNSESGYYNPLIGNPGGVVAPGLADFGTRLKATFTNVPNGMRLFVSVHEVSSTGGNRARLIGSETGAFFPISQLSDRFGLSGSIQDIPVAEVPISNGTGTAVWEIVNHDPLQIGRVDFSIHAAFGQFDVANNLPVAPSQAQIALSFAPTPPSFNAADGARRQGANFPIPRFVDIGTARNLFRLNVCVTNLLFPFVTNQAGFDTGLAIANTSRDPFGTGIQTGTCTLNMYGANAPAAITSPVVTPDAIYTTLASSTMPNFQGYVIAQCRFQYAHGFAFISDLGARNLAMGYLALIIPATADADRPANPFPEAGAGSGEQLGN